MSAPHVVAVVIPARDEEELLPTCLESVARARATLESAHPQIACRVFVVLDSCRDGSASIVAEHGDVSAIPVTAGRVGVARATGIEAAARWAAGEDPARVWIACTDADSAVPPQWLVEQVRLASAGPALVVGTVRPAAGDLTAPEMEEWLAQHSLEDGHDHVHGANLGFTLEAYRAAGGFPPVPVREDVELVAAMRTAGVETLATGSLVVTTSGRRNGRAPGGFAAYVDGLGA